MSWLPQYCNSAQFSARNQKQVSSGLQELRYTPTVPIPVDVTATVLANHRLSDTDNILELQAPEIARHSRPGQFVMVKRAIGREPLLRRPFSVFEVIRDSDGTVTGLSLLSKRVGVVTRDLFAVEPGEHIQCLGPLGSPFTIVEPPMQGWMVAGGVGLAPFATLTEQLRERGVSTTLFYGGRSASDLYHIPFFEQHGVRVILSTEDGTSGEQGYITEPLTSELAKLGEQRVMVYACGPTPMMRAVSKLTAQTGVTTEVSLEQMMGCGLGGCYSCVVQVVNAGNHYVRSCLEGPVFNSEQLNWADLT